jgi:hypothetical protein
LPVFHNAKAIRDRHRFLLVVGYMHESVVELALQPIEFDAHLLPQPSVESRDWLVHQIRFRLAHQRPPNGDALALAAGKVRRQLIEKVSYVQRIRNLYHPSTNVLWVGPTRYQRKCQVLAGAHVRKQSEILEYHRQISIGRRKLGNIAAANENFAGIRCLKPEK